MAFGRAGRYGQGLPKVPPIPQAPARSAGLETLLREGRFEEAIGQSEAAVLRASGDPVAWANLAMSLAAARRLEPALAAWDRALGLAPGSPDLLCGKAAVLQSLGRVEDAAGLYRQALARQPGRFDAAFNLALLAVEAGDWSAADRALAPLLTASPGLPAVRWLAARLAVGRGDVAAASSALSDLVRNPGLGPLQRADAWLLLGDALDALGRHAEAFDAAVAGKALQRRVFADRAAGREGVVARFERLAAWFRDAEPPAWAGAPAVAERPDAPRRHVFLVGFPRSGTTLLEQALAGHRDVVTLEEAPTLAEAHAEFMGSPGDLDRLSRLGTDEAGRWRDRYWAEVRRHGVEPAGHVFVDKAPAGTEDLPLVAKLFPQARILFAIRDPRDVVLSCLRSNFQLNAMTFAFTDLAQAAACYASGMAMAEAYRASLPLAWRDVRHEALVEAFEANLAEICGFLDLSPDPAMADVAATTRGRSVRTPSAPQVRAGLNRKGLGRWRAYGEHLAPVLPVLAPWVARFGYEAG